MSDPADVVYLELDEVLTHAYLAIGNDPQVRDLGLLQSALERPATTVFGADAYPSVTDKAAALMDSIVNNHPLVDGNKRLAWFTAVLFLELNGYRVPADVDAQYAFVLAVAAGEISGVPDIAAGLTSFAVPA